ncbi:MAG: NADH-quinone oxidoreductase subunit M [Thermoguttaceae bacterium]|nr:NADH-quinone oxidoreductase subunit M [Thermoguttaceae bacterium]MDW8079045.1 NADH-quinone oxidoreductase subunit M [Thermoguttaceae bacterium]
MQQLAEALTSPFVILSAIVFLPLLGALTVAVAPRLTEEETKIFSLWITILVLILVLWLAIPGAVDGRLGSLPWDQGRVQYGFSVGWIEAFGVYYFLGLDGINFPLVLLTALLGPLAMLASFGIDRQVRAYCALFLLLHAGMLGVFISLDLFLFYVFWEVVLLPMYFLIGVWGGPRKEYAAIKFFLFTLAGSVLMLVAILLLYFYSDLRLLNEVSLRACQIDPAVLSGKRGQAVHTFNMLALAELARLPQSPFDQDFWGLPVSVWIFWLLMIGFLIKLPAVPLHTWLPDAHVEAPTPISMLLAGVLLKMGGYGILRLCYTICPDAAYQFAWPICAVALVSMVYGALAAMAQSDFKRLVAYSSVSHMGYVLLGLAAWTIVPGDPSSRHYWTMGMSGAVYQMIAHGITSAGMFFLVGVVYDRVHHRDLSQFGGLFNRMPFYSAVSLIIFFAAMGLPGLCGFIGEFFVVVASWRFYPGVAMVAASVVILTAGYILWTVARVFFGPQYRGPHPEALTDMTVREKWVAIPLAVTAVILGIYPKLLLGYFQPSVTRTVYHLATWADRHLETSTTATGPQAKPLGETKFVPSQISSAASLSQTSPGLAHPSLPHGGPARPDGSKNSSTETDGASAPSPLAEGSTVTGQRPEGVLDQAIVRPGADQPKGTGLVEGRR